ncbi:MAG TPA: PAS domain S-box protein [Baekduia sp.]|nr:PAS domain S-box protein [Baekduia sp.]
MHYSIAGDRRADAQRHAAIERVRLQSPLGRVRAFAAGLGAALAGEPRPDRRRFAALQGSAAGTVGLTTALWVEHVTAAGRPAYERRIAQPIRRLTADGRVTRAGPAADYLTATFTTGVTLPLAVDLAALRPLAATLRDPTSVFAGTATPLTSFAGRRGFFVVQGAHFGRGPGSDGFLVIFVPAGWLSLSLGTDPRQVDIRLDGVRLEGAPNGGPAATRRFEALTRAWRVDVGLAPLTDTQKLLPWLAVAWPPAVALLVYLVARGVVRRRRAEREVEDIFELSLDLLCLAGLDGYLRRVNPAFERTLGYSAAELLSRPFLDLVHPDDRERTARVLASLRAGREILHYENRIVRSDGSVLWLQWNTRPIPGQGVMYGVARDVTETRLLTLEQAALRRVALMVARGDDPAAIFRAVTREVSELLSADAAKLLRYESDGSATVVAAHGERGAATAGDAVGREVAVPILVSGRPWGVIVGEWRHGDLAPSDLEQRMAQFTELVATAIANAESRRELSASRARIVTAADETRRRIERDLHDGTQQRLVSLALALRTAEADVPAGQDGLRQRLALVAEGLASVVGDLQELSRGLHPAILSSGGLTPALKALARRAGLPVEVEVADVGRVAPAVEIAAYYVVAEALANAAKHAEASVVEVRVWMADGVLRLVITDDGVGGADPAGGSGLIGLADRVEALGGTLAVRSEARRGTTLTVTLPADAPPVPEPSGQPLQILR